MSVGIANIVVIMAVRIGLVIFGLSLSACSATTVIQPHELKLVAKSPTEEVATWTIPAEQDSHVAGYEFQSAESHPVFKEEAGVTGQHPDSPEPHRYEVKLRTLHSGEKLNPGTQYYFKAKVELTSGSEGYKAGSGSAAEWTPEAVSSRPTGPTEPSGGWKVAYGDAFNAPLGTETKRDNTWEPLVTPRGKRGCCNNDTEIGVFRAAKISTSVSTGLTLTCSRLAKELELGEIYECGGLEAKLTEPTGYKFPVIYPASGATIAFQFIGKWPPNHGTADPAWWAYGDASSGSPEFDFFEGYGWGASCKGWKRCKGTVGHWFNFSEELEKIGFEPDPSIENHTYTLEIFPTGGGRFQFKSWIDGKLVGTSSEGTPAASKIHLKLLYANRKAEEGAAETGFEGSNTMTARSVAVYVDKKHWDEGVGVAHGGLAPGTEEKP